MRRPSLILLSALLLITVSCQDALKESLEQLRQEADRISEVMSDTDADLTGPDVDDYVFTFDKSRYGVDAGASVKIGFTLPERSNVEVIAKEGWDATVQMLSETSGEITVTAPDPACYSEIVAVASTDYGKRTAVALNLIVRDPFTEQTRPHINSLGYYSLKPEHATRENFQKLVDAGLQSVTLECGDYNWKQQLELIKEAGLNFLPIIGDCAGEWYDKMDTYTGLDETVAYLKEQPGLLAYWIRDEPSLDLVYELMCIKEKVESLDPTHPVYINLHPDASVYALGSDYYPEYVEGYAELCALKQLSFDIYPILKTGIQSTWYKCLETVSSTAKRHNVPFWSFAASCWINNETLDRAKPTVENLRLQVYHNLCYGAQVIQYFSICTYSGCDQEFGPIDRYTGKWGEGYDVLKAFNLEMLKRSYVFAGCDVKKVRHTNFMTAWGKQVNNRDYPDVISSLVTSGDALVSFVENRGSEYVVVGNKSWTAKIKVEIELTDMVYTIDRDGVFTERHPGTNEITVDEGDMLVIKYR